MSPAAPALPRPLDGDELSTLLAVADVLMPAEDPFPGARTATGYEASLERALAARPDAFDAIMGAAASLHGIAGEALMPAVREGEESGTAGFGELTAVLAGAYLLLEEVRELLGYPGQRARPARFDEAADEIMNGILDPVLERGPIFREAP